MKAFDLIKPIEEFAPLWQQEKWDNCGFCVGDPNMDVSHALVALDCTEEVVDEAIEHADRYGYTTVNGLTCFMWVDNTMY